VSDEYLDGIMKKIPIPSPAGGSDEIERIAAACEKASIENVAPNVSYLLQMAADALRKLAKYLSPEMAKTVSRVMAENITLTADLERLRSPTPPTPLALETSEEERARLQQIGELLLRGNFNAADELLTRLPASIVARFSRDFDRLLSALRTEAEIIEAVDLIIREMPVPQNTNANWWKAQIYHIRTTIRATKPRIPTSGGES
jgi:hypothetical protein